MAKKKTIKTDITVLLPIHELNNDREVELFKNAINSVAVQEVIPDELMVIVPKDSKLSKELKTFDFGKAKSIVRVVENPGKTDFQSQINYGVEQTNTEWVSILEFDDEYSSKWFKNVIEYKEAHDDVSIFMPIIIDTDMDGQFMGMTNEAVWANSFSDELGLLDNNALLAFQNFNTDGVTMKKELFEEFGGFKSNIKLTFIYEFLLRMTFNGVKTMVIPRWGYKHVNVREGSLFESYQKDMDSVEANFWLIQAKKEYYFPNERDVKYKEITK